MAEFSGLGMHMGNLSRLSRAQSRSISPENFTGAKGRGGMSTDGAAATAGSVTIGSSRRDFRERSASRHTRETTVVSQPPRFSMAAASTRFSRSHASCTASSASLSEPSMR